MVDGGRASNKTNLPPEIIRVDFPQERVARVTENSTRHHNDGHEPVPCDNRREQLQARGGRAPIELPRHSSSIIREILMSRPIYVRHGDNPRDTARIVCRTSELLTSPERSIAAR